MENVVFYIYRHFTETLKNKFKTRYIFTRKIPITASKKRVRNEEIIRTSYIFSAKSYLLYNISIYDLSDAFWASFSRSANRDCRFRTMEQTRRMSLQENSRFSDPSSSPTLHNLNFGKTSRMHASLVALYCRCYSRLFIRVYFHFGNYVCFTLHAFIPRTING